MTKRVFWLIYGIYFVTLAAFVLKLYPPLFTRQVWPAFENTPAAQFTFPAFVMAAAPGGERGPPMSTFRENASRTGFHAEVFPTLRLKLKWKFDLLNVGIHTASKSSPAVDDIGVYVGSDDGWFYKINHDGIVAWKFYAAHADSGFHGTAALDATHAYIAAYNGMLYCLRKTDGAVIWALKLGDGVGASPVIFEDSLYLTPETGSPRNGYVTRVSRANGEVIWKSKWLGQQVHSSPSIDPKNRLLYIGDNDGKITSYNIDDGEMEWAFRVGKEVKSTPAVVGDLVFASAWSEFLYALGTVDGQLRWEAPLGGKSMGSPTYVPGADLLIVPSYGEEGVLHAIHRKDGKEKWSLKTDIKLLIASAAAVQLKGGQEVIFFPCLRKKLCAIDAVSGKVLQQYDVGGLITSVPSIYKDSVYVSVNEGGLLSFGQ